MWISEQILYFLVKCLYRTEIAHSCEMKKALTARDELNTYRSRQHDLIMAAASKYGIDINGKVVLDLGCNEGSITTCYANLGASRVFGVDIDETAIEKAKARYQLPNVSFHASTTRSIPLADASVDVIICYDVFEHVAQPADILKECRRVLAPGGKMLIGTWGWYHPFAPHLWSTMPVPWAHVVFSERTVLRVCRRVYRAPWYVPTMHDMDEKGQKLPDKFLSEHISLDYLNKLLIRDYEWHFRQSGLKYKVNAQPFGSKLAFWTRPFIHAPWVREFLTSYIWVVLEKTAVATAPPMAGGVKR
jgi:2-polyprenyl-3-methyl-5-hydroxy-6-metoxy-1,4-benzoquinol methylase